MTRIWRTDLCRKHLELVNYTYIFRSVLIKLMCPSDWTQYLSVQMTNIHKKWSHKRVKHEENESLD